MPMKATWPKLEDAGIAGEHAKAEDGDEVDEEQGIGALHAGAGETREKRGRHDQRHAKEQRRRGAFRPSAASPARSQILRELVEGLLRLQNLGDALGHCAAEPPDDVVHEQVQQDADGGVRMPVEARCWSADRRRRRRPCAPTRNSCRRRRRLRGHAASPFRRRAGCPCRSDRSR